MARSFSPPPLRLIRSLWGVEIGRPEQWPAVLATAAGEGFGGIECCAPGTFFPFGEDVPRLRALLAELDLRLIVQCHAGPYPVRGAGWRAHADALRRQCETTLASGLTPLLFNCHSGKDSQSIDDALRFFEAAVELERDLGVRFAHETHRQRVLHSPFALLELQRRGLPAGVKLTADLSHYVVMLERCPDDDLDDEFWPAVMDVLRQRCVYIHARVGHSQGPQVNDPTAPEHAAVVGAHVSWWRSLVAAMRQRAPADEVLVCPEYGPHPYLAVLPRSQAPVEDLAAICRASAAMLRHQLG